MRSNTRESFKLRPAKVLHLMIPNHPAAPRHQSLRSATFRRLRRKHSGTDRFCVELSGTGDEVRLEVKDAGIGFDVKATTRIGGLGLTSMRERVRMFNGRFYIESKPGAGTKIIASMPVAAGESAEKALSDDTANIAGAA